MEIALPDKPSLDDLEAKWDRRWSAARLYEFDRSAPRERIFSIDTPPPTVSGSLHVGHVFSYTHTDIIARFQRMLGREVFYPMGWDDNGLPTERRVQNYYGVRCDPSLPYTDGFTPPAKPSAKPSEQVPVSRKNFVELCHGLTRLDERAFEALWRRVGVSVDWSMTYATIDDDSRAIAQRGFLRNLDRGEAYLAEAPTLWDTTFRTAVAQAELEDRETPGAFHELVFHHAGADIRIQTTRPELLPACVALVASPDDERYQPLFGTTARTPLFEVDVPILSHPLADPDKGSGIAMVCTFGDLTDVTWWRELQLPTPAIVSRDGRISRDTPDWITSDTGRKYFADIAGKTVFSAKQAIVDALRANGELIGAPRPIKHAVKYYEKGDRPLEIVTSRQWYITNGGRDEDLKRALLARGAELRWHPAHMLARFENWVEGLTGDWLISRQRFFGVPIPVWYPLDAQGEVDYTTPLVPNTARLPIDPAVDLPDGYSEAQRGVPGGFVADPDVMDTWATSSLTPQIAGRWTIDDDLFERVFPMNLRPQAHEIIRTWLFSTVLRAHLEHGELPWQRVAISGWILDPDRKKMSKSVGNVVTPMDLLEKYGSDGARYWAAKGRPGADTAFDEGMMKIGRRLAIKLLNASKFVLSIVRDGDAVPATAVVNPLDQALLQQLAGVVDEASGALADYDYTRALETTEEFFWRFCDNYLELVKDRAYDRDDVRGSASARATLLLALDVQARLLAPFLPFATEEVWSWWHDGSIHRTSWPVADELTGVGGTAQPLDVAEFVIGEIRKAKAKAGLSMRAELARVAVRGLDPSLGDGLLADVGRAGKVTAIEAIPSDKAELRVEITQ
ncbi:MAG TPA: valine--tRNA ligase [Jatrophihabitantaceae bacterium]